MPSMPFPETVLFAMAGEASSQPMPLSPFPEMVLFAMDGEEEVQ